MNNMLTLITKSTCCTHQYTYHDLGPASQSSMIIISKNISTSSMAAYHDIFHQHQLICWWCSALTSAGVAHLWIFYLIILHCSLSWSNWWTWKFSDMFYHVSAKIKQTWNLLKLRRPLVKNTFFLVAYYFQKTKRTFTKYVENKCFSFQNIYASLKNYQMSKFMFFSVSFFVKTL